MRQPLETIAAVKCAQCAKLHPIDSMSYLTIEGTITRRRGMIGRVQDQAQHLGTEPKPTVLCDNASCLLIYLKLAD